MTRPYFTQSEIEIATAQFPNLCAFGFRDVPHAGDRLLTEEGTVKEVSACAWFIREMCAPTKTLRRSVSSYGWKHLVENALGLYVSNGAFIAAAILCGYRVERVGPRNPNAVFNMRVPTAALWAFIDDSRMSRSIGVWVS
jgi:hypothetical protein